MKPGIAVSTYLPKYGPIVLTGENIDENLTLARDLGYQGVDLFLDHRSDAEIDHIGYLMDKLGLEMSMCIVIYLVDKGVNFSDADAQNRKFSVNEYKRHIDIAHRMNAKTMPVGFLRGNQREGESGRSYQDRLAGSMRELCEYAASRSIELCMEPINRYEIQSFLRVEEVVDFIETYRIEGLKILPDFFHMNIEEASMEEALRIAGNKIAHMHVADSNRLAPGHGHLDYEKLLGTLKEIGYEGYLTVEALPKPDGLECARQGARFLIDMLQRIGG